ncbi:MAG: GNAT family N-acetyltransferase [Acaryochloridaceae cyanobacterium SU_2_1]|nr:GNAT family N-acetyltransferase [Acaryochloridaceae cyanobacterium SU_2_1]
MPLPISFQSDLRIVLTAYADQASQIFKIRQQVFHQEQGIAADLDMDGEDDHAEQFIAYIQGQPVGIARMRAYGHQLTQAKIERVAVLPEFRGQGIGRAILEKMLAHARQQDFATALVYAQEASIPFYEQLGFCKQGKTFIQAGIPHLALTKNLSPPSLALDP